MLTVSLRDLQFRKRQFAIAIVGAALVFAMALILTGVREGFNTETRNVVEGTGADGWVVAHGVSGPFTTSSTIPDSVAREVARQPGVKEASPFAARGDALRHANGKLVNIDVVGAVPGQLGSPTPTSGSAISGAGQVVVDDKLGGVGDRVQIGGHRFKVVGTVSGRTYFGGVPVAYLRLADLQNLAFHGQPLSTGIPFKGRLTKPPKGFSELDNNEVEQDMRRVLGGAVSTIDSLRVLMWVVAAVIIGTVMYLSALERLTDFAVLKAVGADSRKLAIGLSLQSVIASLASALLAAALAQALKPGFPLVVTIKPVAYISLAAIAVAVGILASLLALRRVLGVDPALAFG